MCIYQVRAGAETDFEALLGKHWPTLKSMELVTDRRSQVFRGVNDDKSVFFVEFIEWLDESAPETAHELPEVAAVWEAMGPLCEARGGKPPMEFPHVERLY
jgi:hypothetical protein